MIMSSRIQLPTDTPPQLMPPTRLPAKLSRRGRSLILFGLCIDMGLAAANDSCLDRPMLSSNPVPVVMILADACESGSR